MFSSALTPLVALVTAPVLARVLGVDGRGEVAAATAPLFLMAALTTLALPEAVTYFVARSPGAIRQTLKLSLGLIVLSGAAGTFAVIVLATPLSRGDSQLAGLIAVAGVALIPTQITAVLRGSAAGLGQWNLVVADRVVAALLRLVGVVVLAMSGALTPLSATVIIGSAPAVSGLVYVALRWPARDNGLRPPGIANYGMRLWGSAIGAVLLSRLDQVLMIPLAGVYELGLYAVAVSIGEVPLIAQLALRQVLFSADSAKQDDVLMAQASRIVCSASLVVGLILAVVTPWAIPLLFGPDFSEAVGPALLLILATVSSGAAAVSAAGLTSRGRPGILTLTTLTSLMVATVLMLTLIPSLGAVGAATATLAANTLNALLIIVSFSKVSGITGRRLLVTGPADMHAIIRRLRRANPGPPQEETDA